MQTVRKERIILRKLIKNYIKGRKIVSFQELNIKDEFYPKDLEKKNLVTIVGTGRKDEYGKFEYYNHLQLTEQGKHYFSFRWERIKMFLLKSVLVPIAVSIITTILVLLIKGLLR
ncbi:hypothetical protein [Limosilactobacillus portuensis]|uniref:hypothetical protein n=1 Tax=Limosilactobacillus portuensis TaxID=2742601 RepID=UPI0032674BE0